MAYVNGAENDVFISYAHIDNEAASSEERWVSRFTNDLGRALRRRLGNTDDLRIFFDDRDLSGSQALDALVENAKRSALFLSVVSPSYVQRSWTMRELEAFFSVAGPSERIFLVETLPLDTENAYPRQISNIKRTKFWVPASDTEIPITLDARLTPERYLARIEDLAEQMRRRLRQLRTTGIGESALSHRDAEAKPAQTVLLGQVTDDLDEDREGVRRYLEQYKITVLPSGTYPQGGSDFQAAFEADCRQARLFVQLLGQFPARSPPDLPSGYGQAQYETAKRLGLTIKLWRRPNLDVKQLSHRDVPLLAAPEVVATGLESFKSDILQTLRAPLSANKPPPSETLVFINADRRDLAIAEALGEEFGRNNCATVLPVTEGTAEEILKDLEDNLIDCTALVLVYGSSTPVWVRGQVRLYTKLKPRRQHPPRLLAIYTGPPEAKPDIGLVLPEARRIDCRRGFSVEPVRQLISELLQ